MKSVISLKKNLFFVLCSLFVVVYWLFLIRPALLQQIGGTLKTTEIPQDYQVLANFLAEDKDFARTFWLPRRDKFGFYSNAHPPVEAQDFVSEVREKRPLSSLLVDKYNFLSYFQNPATREIFKILGLKYLLVPFDSQEEIFLTDRKYDERKYQRRVDELDKVPWLKRSALTSKIGLYEADFETEHFFPVKTTFFVVGPDDFYATFSGLPLSQFGFSFLEENFGQKAKMGQKDVLLFNKKGEEDLFLSFVEEKFVFPFFPFVRKKNCFGWEAIDLVNSARTIGFKNFGFDFGKNFVLSRGGGSFSFPFTVPWGGEYEIFLRFLQNHLGGEIVLVLDGREKVKILTRGEDSFVWKKIFTTFLKKGKHSLFIQNKKGVNGLNLLVVLPKGEAVKYRQRTEKYLEGRRVLTLEDLPDFSLPNQFLFSPLPQITSYQLSPTKYRVEVRGAKEPFWLVFSEAYNPLWRAKIGKEEVEPVRLYSLINGFYLKKTGDFAVEVEFSPQRCVFGGVVGSGMVVLSIVLFLIGELTVKIKANYLMKRVRGAQR